MRFQILGPVRVVVDSREVTVTAGRDQVLLGVLLLHANRLVTSDQLIDVVWPGQPPRDARNQLQGCVSRLRKRFTAAGSDRVIVTEPAGYRLVVEPGDLDLLEFRRLVREARGAAGEGRYQDAVTGFRAALALWRGPALAGIDGHAIVRAAAGLDEERIHVLEERLDAELAAGGGGELVAELTELVGQHPLREGLHRSLMLALYRAGRQADALAAYRRARDLLRDELGTEPGAPLRELHQAILNGDPELDAPPPPLRARGVSPTPRQLPSDVAGFSGRTTALKQLDELLARRPQSTGPVVITAIAGTAGVGKTALAVHWAHQVADQFPDGQLYVNLRGFDPAGSPVEPASAVRGFLDALSVPPERIPKDLDAQISLYRSVLADRRILVVLDNARDAEQVRPLLPGAPGCLVLVTSRNQLPGLVATEGAIPISLAVLPDEEARQLLAARLGTDRIAAEPDAVTDLVSACAGLPLALAVVAARAAARPRFSLAAIARQVREAEAGLESWTGPDNGNDLRAVFSWSYQALEPEAARVFRLLGLHPGPDLATPAAASLAAVPLAQMQRLLTNLADANLLIEHVPGRWTLHDLIRAFARELADAVDTGPDRRAAVHRLLDHYVHTVYAARLLLGVTLRLPHELPASQPGAQQIELSTRDAATTWLASEQAVLLNAIEMAADGGFHTHVWQLAMCLGHYLHWQGQWDRWLSTQRDALCAALRLGDRAVEAHAHFGIGTAYTAQARFDHAREHLQQALDLSILLSDRHMQAFFLHNMGWLAERQGDYEEALRCAQTSYGLFRQLMDPVGRARSLSSIAWCYSLLGDHRQAILNGELAIATLQEVGDRSEEGMAWDSVGHAYYQLGEHRRAVECYQRALRLIEMGAYHLVRGLVYHRLGDACHALGDLSAAGSAWQSALAIFQDLDHPEADAVRAKLDDADSHLPMAAGNCHESPA